MDYFQDGQRGRKKEKKKGTEKGKEERDGKSRQEASEETTPKVLCPGLSGHFNLHTNENPPVLTESHARGKSPEKKAATYSPALQAVPSA